MRTPTLTAFVFSLFSVAAQPALAQAGVWSPMGPSASTVQHMLVDSAEPLFLYVGNSQSPSMGGYRSAPYLMNVQPGLIWSPLTLADGTLLSAISVSPTQSGRVYAGACLYAAGPNVTTCQYYRSSDFGATWALIYTPPGNVVLLSIVEAPTASSILYAAGNRFGMGGGPGAFVAKSSDGGATWSDISAGLPGAPDANSNGLGSIVVDPTNASILYVGTQAGVYKTSNGGMAWASSGAGIPSGLVTALIINPTTANQVFAGVGPTQQNSFAGAGVYMTSNGGITWGPANMGLTSLKVLSLAFDSRGPSILWAGTGDSGVFESTDGGATWNALNNGLVGGSLAVTAIASSQVAGSDDVFIGTGNGAFTMSITPGQTEAVIEYYAAKQDHYFMTAGAAEIQALDNGTIPGWVRTGQSFKAYSQAGTGLNPVCRFYIPPAKGDSHFYSANPAECAAILDAATNPANPLHATYVGFIEESASVFFIGVPSAGQCVAGTLPVYRLWNQRPDTNHRYTTSTTIRDQMVSLGYADEGVVMCAPQ